MTSFWLQLGKEQIALARGANLLAGTLIPGLPPSAIFGVVNVNPKNPNMLGLQNLSDRPWKALLSDGQQRTVEPQKSIALTDGMRIDFGGVTGLVSLARPAPPAAEFNERIDRAEMERLSRKLQRAAHEGRIPEAEYTSLHQAFIARDEAGGFWSFGLKTRHWYQMSPDGQWRPGTAPDILFLRQVLESLRALEKRTAASGRS